MLAPAVEVSPASLTQREWLSLSWAFMWRGLCFTLVTTVAGAVVGGMLGLVVGVVSALAGWSIEAIRTPLQISGGVLGFGMGFYLIRYYIGWLLRARLGSLRFVVVRLSQMDPINV